METRRHIGMVFQKPNPFPAMTIAENVLAGLKFSAHLRRQQGRPHRGVPEKAGLWNEVKDRQGELGGALSGGQQQRLCIARSLAVKPRVLLMDEPCSALDPTSTLRIEQTIKEIADEVTVVIVTHNMQQAQRVSDHWPSSSPRRTARSGDRSGRAPSRSSASPPIRGRSTMSMASSGSRGATPRVCARRVDHRLRGARGRHPGARGGTRHGQSVDAVDRLQLRERGHPAVGGPVLDSVRAQHQLAGVVVGPRTQQLRPEPGRLRRLRHPLQPGQATTTRLSPTSTCRTWPVVSP